MANLGERIKSLRLSKGISSEELAYLTGLNQSTISRIESNQRTPSLDTILKICESLEITIIELFESEDAFSPDLLNLISTAKKLTPKQREKITEMIESFLT